MQDEHSRPEISPLDITGYDRLFLGFPIWWGVEPRVVDTFFDSFQLKGKEVYLFATSGGSPIDTAAYAAISDWADRVVDVNGAEPLKIADYIDYYNNWRPQAGLGKMTPAEFRDYLLARPIRLPVPLFVARENGNPKRGVPVSQ